MSDFDKIKDVLGQLIGKLQAQTELNKLALAGIRIIKSRTRKGEFLEGSSANARRYSESWAARRERAGLPTDVVNLTFDDLEGMMSQIDYTISGDQESVDIDIADFRKREIAYFHSVSGAGRSRIKRVFFDFSEEEENQLTELVQRDLVGLLTDLANEV